MASQSARRERGDPVNVLSAAAFKGRVTWVLPPSARCESSNYAKPIEPGLGTHMGAPLITRWLIRWRTARDAASGSWDVRAMP